MDLLGMADANCCFTLIDVGAYGCENNSSVFINLSFGKAFSSGDLNVPSMRNVPRTRINMPLYFIVDEAFPLKPNLMRPFTCVVCNYIRKTQTTEIKRREEEILEQEQQNVTASVKHTTCFVTV